MINIILKAITRLFSEEYKLDIRNIRYLPRWVVLCIDLLLVLLALFATYYLLKGLNSSPLAVISLSQQAGLILGVNFIFLIFFKTYAGLVRHSRLYDAFKILLASLGTLGTLLIINRSFYFFYGEKLFLDSGLAVYFLLSFMVHFIFRLGIKQLYDLFKRAQPGEESINTVILGIDESCISIAAALEIEEPRRFVIQGFISKQRKKGLRIRNKPVLLIEPSVHKLLKQLDSKAVILAGNGFTAEERFTIVKDCLDHDIQVYNSPLVRNWSDKTTVTDQLKTLQIEDLLNRDPIQLNDEIKSRKIQGRTILVTGGAGSIGSEITRQVASFNPARLIILDQAETPLHSLKLELDAKFTDVAIEYIICDVANRNRLRLVFDSWKIDIIYHAAAYKHVPLMEGNPSEAIVTNIYGTKNIADIALQHDVSHFVMVSTDKAVNPTNVMGASKRAAEMYVQSKYFNIVDLEVSKKTKFIVTRFGNVLGSNGSVVPLFKKQIKAGGPVTITHPDIIRYFMTIPEACQLVLEAGAMGKGGEIFIFDMGAPVRIMDLAEKMIKLAGYKVQDDIEIKITGLRPGEKLYEELLSDSSKTLPTHHDKIMISEDVCADYDTVNNLLSKIIKAAINNNNNDAVAALKILVPEFKSKNSQYEFLDTVVE